MVRLKHWLLWFGAESAGPPKIVREFGDWMDNRRPPWAVYRALMLERLISLNKCPVEHPFRVVETW